MALSLFRDGKNLTSIFRTLYNQFQCAQLAFRFHLSVKMISMSKFAALLACLCVLVLATSAGKDADDRQVNTKDGFKNETPSDVNEKDGVTRRRRADDVDLAALQTIVQQQAATIQQMESRLTATQNEITTLKQSLPSTFSAGQI